MFVPATKPINNPTTPRRTGNLHACYIAPWHEIVRFRFVFPQPCIQMPPAHFRRTEPMHALEVTIEVTYHCVTTSKRNCLNRCNHVHKHSVCPRHPHLEHISP